MRNLNLFLISKEQKARKKETAAEKKGSRRITAGESFETLDETGAT
jgi:hypothetical protein